MWFFLLMFASASLAQDCYRMIRVAPIEISPEGKLKVQAKDVQSITDESGGKRVVIRTKDLPPQTLTFHFRFDSQGRIVWAREDFDADIARAWFRDHASKCKDPSIPTTECYTTMGWSFSFRLDEPRYGCVVDRLVYHFQNAAGAERPILWYGADACRSLYPFEKLPVKAYESRLQLLRKEAQAQRLEFCLGNLKNGATLLESDNRARDVAIKCGVFAPVPFENGYYAPSTKSASPRAQ